MSSNDILSASHATRDRQKQKAFETWDNIKGALIGVAATRFQSFLGEMVPGFHEQFDKAHGDKGPDPLKAAPSPEPSNVT